MSKAHRPWLFPFSALTVAVSASVDVAGTRVGAGRHRHHGRHPASVAAVHSQHVSPAVNLLHQGQAWYAEWEPRLLSTQATYSDPIPPDMTKNYQNKSNLAHVAFSGWARPSL